MTPVRLPYLLAVAVAVAFAVALLLHTALVQAEDAGAARAAAELAAAVDAGPGPSPTAVVATEGPRPQPDPTISAPAGVSEIVRLWRAGYLAAAVALALHLALGAALVRWAWLVEIVPPLGRWKWRAITSSALAALAVTLPAAITGVLTWPGLIWPLVVGVALAVLPGMPPLQQQLPAGATR